MDGDKTKWALTRDRLLLVALALVIVAPFAVYVYVARDVPVVVRSADDLRRLPASETFILSQGLTDEDLVDLERFDSLEVLELHYSEVTDAGVPAIARHRGLTRLVLYSMALTDAGAAQLSALTGLQELVLIGCVEVTSDGLSWLGDLQHLRTLVLHQCARVDGRVVGLLRGCPQLESVTFENLRRLTDDAAFTLAEYKRLRHVHIDFCPNIGNEGVARLATLPELETLTLHGLGGLDDSVLPELAKATKLKHLQLPLRTEFSVQALSDLREALPDCEVLYKDNYVE